MRNVEGINPPKLIPGFQDSPGLYEFFSEFLIGKMDDFWRVNAATAAFSVTHRTVDFLNCFTTPRKNTQLSGNNEQELC